MGFITGTKEVRSESPFQKWTFEEVGDTLYFMMSGHNTRNSAEWGEFKVIEGVKFNPDANNAEELQSSLQPISFVANTVLWNYVQSNTLRPYQLYCITFQLERGGKYIKDGKTHRAKANHYKVEMLEVQDKNLVKMIKDAIPSLVSAKHEVDNEACDEESDRPTISKPRI